MSSEVTLFVTYQVVTKSGVVPVEGSDQGDGNHIGQHCEDVHVVDSEIVVVLVDDLHDPDDLAIDMERYGENRSGGEAETAVEILVKAFIKGDIAHYGRLSMSINPAGQASLRRDGTV